MRWLALLLALAAPSVAEEVIKFQKGSLEVYVSSDDLAHLNVREANFILVACRTTNPDTARFEITLYFTLDGEVQTRSATVPRLPDNLVLPGGLIANFPWTTFSFVLPPGARITGKFTVEERVGPVVFGDLGFDKSVLAHP